MRKGFLLAAVTVLCIADPTGAEENKLAVTFDLTYMSKYMSKGVEAYGQQPALFKTVDIDFWQTGFGIKVAHRNCTSSGYVNKARFDYRPYYKSELFQGKPYATKYDISIAYEHYPGLSRHKAKTTYEWIFAFSWPNLFPKGITPGYKAIYEYPASSGETYPHVTGWTHHFILSYDIKVKELQNPLHLSAELAYIDGLVRDVHDWGYFTVGLSNKFKISDNLSFTPGIYHQTSLDDQVSKRKDVTYGKLSLKYKF